MTFSEDGTPPPGAPSPLSDPPAPPPPHPEEETSFILAAPDPEPGLPLHDTTPFRDFVELWRRPRAFFEYFARPGPVGTWVTLKAIVGLCFLSWLTAFVTRDRQIADALRAVGPYLDRFQEFASQHLPFALGLGLDPQAPDMRAQAARMFVGFLQVSFVLAPFITLFSLLLTASTAWVCLPLVGVSERRFGKIFVAGVYANWFVLLYVIPVVGPVLTLFAGMTYFTLAVKWIHRIGFLRAFLALYVLAWVLVGLTVGFFGLLLAALAGVAGR